MAEKGNRFALLEHGWSLSGDMAVDNNAYKNINVQLCPNRPPIKLFEFLYRKEHANLVDWVKDMNRNSFFKPLPPYNIVRYPVLLERAWGFGRLFPIEMSEDPEALANYQEFYRRNCSVAPSVAAAVSLCLRNEYKLRSEWEIQGANVQPYNRDLSDKILKCASNLVDKMNAESVTVAYAALVCVQTLHFSTYNFEFSSS
uniref:Uncharacterized protein n=1 Tax=Leersia perrieri TaxID=77586 RepID=A0A0D9XXH2_9ORYZ